jgi:CheY-like chemotaxis protein
MPEMDGFETIKLIRGDEKLKNLRVHVWTGVARPGDIDRAYSLGVTSCMMKPGTLPFIEQTLTRLHKLHEVITPPPGEG